MQKTNTKHLALGAIMLALATMLSYIKVYQLPYGGCITLLSMLPIIIFALYAGLSKGLIVAFLYGIIQVYLGDSPLGWGLTGWTLVACLTFDYILAFGVLGLVGLFKNAKMPAKLAGISLVMGLRLLCHFISGVTIWQNFAQFQFMGKQLINPYLYSIIYNGSYMLPEIIFTVIASFIILKHIKIKETH